MVPHIHPSATVGPRVEIAEDAVIGPHCRLDGRTTIGARARLVANVSVADTRIGEDCRLGEGVSIDGGCVVERGSRIGMRACIEPGSVVARSIHPYAIAGGDPATVRGFATTAEIVRDRAADGAAGGAVVSPVAGVVLHRFPRFQEVRGTLSVAEVGRQIPFDVKRYFMVCNVPKGELRGEHAHTECQELLVCVQGSVTVLVDDGHARQEFVLDNPDIGLHIPNLVWTTQYKHSPDAVLVALTSHPYEARDYIKDYETFLADRRAALADRHATLAPRP